MKLEMIPADSVGARVPFPAARNGPGQRQRRDADISGDWKRNRIADRSPASTVKVTTSRKSLKMPIAAR